MKKNDAVHFIWLSLIGLTLITYAMSFVELSGVVMVSVLMATAYSKGVLIIREFMALKGVSLIWRLIMYGWLTVVCLAVFLAYFFT